MIVYIGLLGGLCLYMGLCGWVVETWYPNIKKAHYRRQPAVRKGAKKNVYRFIVPSEKRSVKA